MLTITHAATGKNFELPTSLNIPFEFTNPAIAEYNSLSLAFSLKNTAINAMLTGYPHLPGAPNNTKTIPVVLAIDSDKMNCLLELISADEAEIKCNLAFNEADFFSQYGEKSLRECDLGEFDLTTFHSEGNINGLPAWTDEMYTKKWPDIPAAFFPVHNSEFYAGSEWDELYRRDSKVQNLPKAMRVKLEGDPHPSYYWPITPFPFMAELNKNMFQYAGYRLHTDYTTQSALKQLCMINVNDMADAGIQFFEGAYPAYPYFYNRYFKLQNHVPNLTVSKYFKDLSAKFNLHPFVDATNKTVRLLNLDQILSNPATVDFSEYFSEYFSGIELTEIKEYTGYQFTMGGFKSALLEQWAISYDSVKANIHTNRVYLESELSEPGTTAKYSEVRIVYNPVADLYYYYQLKFTYASGGESAHEWVQLGLAKHADVLVGTTETPLKFESEINYTFGNLRGIYYKNAEGNAQYEIFSFPMFDTQGYSMINPDAKPQDAVCWAFYLGIPESTYYPRASYRDVYEAGANTIELRFDGEKGLISHFFKHTLEMRINRGRLFKANVWMPAAKLFAFDYAQKYKIGAGTYLVKKIIGYFTINGIEFKEAELMEV